MQPYLTRMCIHDGLLVLEAEDVQPIGRETGQLAFATDSVSAETALVVGCGSGLIALHLARRGVSVTAMDINPSATRICAQNSVINGLQDRIQTINADVYQTTSIGPFDLVVSNPPQLPTGSLRGSSKGGRSWTSLANDGGPDGREFINWLSMNSRSFLVPGGTLMFTHFDYLRPAKTVELLERNGFAVEIDTGLRKRTGPWSTERLRHLGLSLDQYKVHIISARYELSSG